MQEKFSQFVQDALRVSGDLDKISRRDRPEVLARAVEAGRLAYEELLRRRESLELTRADATHLQGILDGIRARLKFLS